MRQLVRFRFFVLLLALFILLFGGIGAYLLLTGHTILTGHTASNQMSVNWPANATTCSTRFSSQEVYNTFWTLPPPSSGPTPKQRMDNLGLDYWRLQATDGYDGPDTSNISPLPYTTSQGYQIQAWNFNDLDKIMAAGPVGAPRLLDSVRPPDPMWTGPDNTQATLIDQTYNALGQFYANVLTYYRKGILQSNSGNTVTYTSTSLTDTTKDFTAYAGGDYAVTATVLDTNGFSDWVTGSIIGVSDSGHTVNISAWTASHSGASVSSPTPAAGAAYNLASSTPPITSPTPATPWPRPPAVGNVQYVEIFNEPDLSNGNYDHTSPSLSAPKPILRGVNVSGGTLTPGTTYTYRMTAVNIGTAESLPSTEVSITLPGGTNAVRIDWSATSNHGLSPFAYRIYGRTSGAEEAMVVVGKDASSGLKWTDTGAVGPSGALPTTDSTSGYQLWRAREYTKMWNVVAPQLKAVDQTLKLIGPTLSGATQLAGTSTVTTAITTGPDDSSWKDDTDYIPYLMAHGSPRPDIVSFHDYGNYQGSASTDSSYFRFGLQAAINGFHNVDQSSVGNVPVWITETNIESGFLDNTDYRERTQFGSAWQAYNYISWCQNAPQIQELFQFEVQNGITFSLFAGSPPPRNCYPQPTCLNSKASEPDHEYWLIHWMNRYFPAGSKVVPVSGVPTGFAAFAIQPPGSNKVSVVVANIQTNDARPGQGVVGRTGVQLSGINSSDTQQIIIDGNTDITNGPAVTDLGATNKVNLSLNGYGVAILSFNTGSSSHTTPS